MQLNNQNATRLRVIAGTAEGIIYWPPHSFVFVFLFVFVFASLCLTLNAIEQSECYSIANDGEEQRESYTGLLIHLQLNSIPGREDRN